MIGYDCLPALLEHVPNRWELPSHNIYASACTQGNPKTRTPRKDKEGGGTRGRTLYAESVYLSACEYEKLAAAYGEKNARRMIDKLSAYKGAKGKRYRSDYKAILNWVAAAVLGTKSAAVPEPVRSLASKPVLVDPRKEARPEDEKHARLEAARFRVRTHLILSEDDKRVLREAGEIA